MQLSLGDVNKHAGEPHTHIFVPSNVTFLATNDIHQLLNWYVQLSVCNWVVIQWQLIRYEVVTHM